MYLLNCTLHENVGGCLNLEENRKKTVIEYLYSDYVDKDTRLRVIVHEIFEDMIEKGLSSRNRLILIFNKDIDILLDLEDLFDLWDIEIEAIE